MEGERKGEEEDAGTARVYSSGRSTAGWDAGSSSSRDRDEMLIASSSNWLEWIDNVADEAGEAGEAIVKDLPGLISCRKLG